MLPEKVDVANSMFTYSPCDCTHFGFILVLILSYVLIHVTHEFCSAHSHRDTHTHIRGHVSSTEISRVRAIESASAANTPLNKVSGHIYTTAGVDYVSCVVQRVREQVAHFQPFRAKFTTFEIFYLLGVCVQK